MMMNRIAIAVALVAVLAAASVSAQLRYDIHSPSSTHTYKAPARVRYDIHSPSSTRTFKAASSGGSSGLRYDQHSPSSTHTLLRASGSSSSGNATSNGTSGSGSGGSSSGNATSNSTSGSNNSTSNQTFYSAPVSMTLNVDYASFDRNAFLAALLAASGLPAVLDSVTPASVLVVFRFIASSAAQAASTTQTFVATAANSPALSSFAVASVGVAATPIPGQAPLSSAQIQVTLGIASGVTFQSATFASILQSAYNQTTGLTLLSTTAGPAASGFASTLVVVFTFQANTQAAADNARSGFIALGANNSLNTTYPILGIYTPPSTGAYTEPIAMVLGIDLSQFDNATFISGVVKVVDGLATQSGGSVSQTNASAINIISLQQASTLVVFQIGVSDPALAAATAAAFAGGVNSGNFPYAVEQIAVSGSSASVVASVLAAALVALLAVVQMA